MGQVPRDTVWNFKHWRPFWETSNPDKTPLVQLKERPWATPTSTVAVKPGTKNSSRDNLVERLSSRDVSRDEKVLIHVNVLESLLNNKCSTSFGNDPSAGSPTETLLRLLLPLNDQV